MAVTTVTTIAKNENVSIKAKAVKALPYNFSLSSGFLAPATIKEPKSIPVPNAPKAIGMVVNPIINTLKHFNKIKILIYN